MIIDNTRVMMKYQTFSKIKCTENNFKFCKLFLKSYGLLFIFFIASESGQSLDIDDAKLIKFNDVVGLSFRLKMDMPGSESLNVNLSAATGLLDCDALMSYRYLLKWISVIAYCIEDRFKWRCIDTQIRKPPHVKIIT